MQQIFKQLNQLLADRSTAEHDEITAYLSRISRLDFYSDDLGRNQLVKEFEAKYPIIAKVILDGFRAATPRKKPKQRGSRFYP